MYWARILPKCPTRSVIEYDSFFTPLNHLEYFLLFTFIIPTTLPFQKLYVRVLFYSAKSFSTTVGLIFIFLTVLKCPTTYDAIETEPNSIFPVNDTSYEPYSCAPGALRFYAVGRNCHRLSLRILHVYYLRGERRAMSSKSHRTRRTSLSTVFKGW